MDHSRPYMLDKATDQLSSIKDGKQCTHYELPMCYNYLTYFKNDFIDLTYCMFVSNLLGAATNRKWNNLL